MRHLATRMHPLVCSPASMNLYYNACEFKNHFFDPLLHSDMIWLNLPAGIC
jgi:hypothetical protein